MHWIIGWQDNRNSQATRLQEQHEIGCSTYDTMYRCLAIKFTPKLKPESVFSGAWSKSWSSKIKKGFCLFGSAGPIAPITSALFLYFSPHNKIKVGEE